MNERIRIYDLARQMHVSNQTLIDALREMGYDVKSHSSTIDGNVVGLLIDKLNKNKSKGAEKEASKVSGKLKTKVKEEPVAIGAKKDSLPKQIKVEPPPPPVKPRVLSRRKPIPQLLAEPQPAQDVVGSPVVEEQPVTIEPQVNNDTGIAAEKAETILDGNYAPIEPQLNQQDLPGQEKPLTVNEPLSDVLDSINETKTSSISEHMIRHAPPSVPIRIAAPSIRAMPPRPPKTHRPPSPSERHIQPARKEDKPHSSAVVAEIPKVIVLTGALTVNELAELMGVSDTEVVKRLFMKGFMRTVNQLVELELAKELATEMEYEVLTEAQVVESTVIEKVGLSEKEQAALIARPPVVTIMGHVDHGKTSLLDAIRQTKFSLTDAESGGITQHIGAYHVEVPGEDGNLRQIIFLDTPGHEAFTAMRARGAKVTDIAVLVVAADDGVMPQTVEAIDHARAAEVPIIVAVNKVDKPDADPDRVLNQLMEHNVIPDRYGGDTVTVNVSAKNRTGLDELLEMILLVADMADLKANPDRAASGTIIEAELSRGKGAVATALVQNGTLREGNFIVAGSCSGRVRALFDDRGQRVKAAGPSMPVEVLGLDEVPQAGDLFEVVEDIQASKVLAEQRKTQGIRRTQHVTLESLHDLLEQGQVKELNVIIKADVQGTAEAIAEQVGRLSTVEVQVKVIRVASGGITENDVNLAASADAIIIGFHVEPDQNASRVKELSGVDIRTYKVIYQITDDLEKAIQGLIQPIKQEVEIGIAEVRQIFKFGKNLTIAGCYVLSGKVQRGCLAKIERGSEIIYEGKLDTLKRFKDEAREVAQGFECGMSFEKFNGLQEGDTIRCFIIQETKREPTR